MLLSSVLKSAPNCHTGELALEVANSELVNNRVR